MLNSAKPLGKVQPESRIIRYDALQVFYFCALYFTCLCYYLQ